MTCFTITAGLLLLFCSLIDGAPVKSNLQVIPPLPGYVPVYIRKGDQPLEEINQQLAEAFQALEAKSAHEKSASADIQNRLATISREAHHKQTGYDTTNTDMADILKKKIFERIGGNGHIQKIPKTKN